MQWSERIGRRIKLRDLHVLLAVVRSGSMSKAAKDLAVSHPVVVKVVADLERTLGVRLLDRDRHGVEPTIYGRAMLEYAVAAFEELRRGVQAVEFLLDPGAGELRIGGPDPMIAGLFPAIIGRLSQQYPRLVFRVTVASPGLGQFQQLRDREFEILVGRLPRSLPDDDLDVEILFDEPLQVAAGAENPWLRRRRIELADLMDEPWVLPTPESVPGPLVAELFESAGLRLPARAVVCASLQMNDALLATGRYLAVYPASVLRLTAKLRAVRVLPVRLPEQSRPVGIVTLKRRIISPSGRLFIDCARALTRSLANAQAPRRRGLLRLGSES